MLLSAGIDVDLPGEDGHTAVMMAVRVNNRQKAQWLLGELGLQWADPTPIHTYAAQDIMADKVHEQFAGMESGCVTQSGEVLG
jgi:hypothetical protein